MLYEIWTAPWYLVEKKSFNELWYSKKNIDCFEFTFVDGCSLYLSHVLSLVVVIRVVVPMLLYCTCRVYFVYLLTACIEKQYLM